MRLLGPIFYQFAIVRWLFQSTLEDVGIDKEIFKHLFQDSVASYLSLPARSIRVTLFYRGKVWQTFGESDSVWAVFKVGDSHQCLFSGSGGGLWEPLWSAGKKSLSPSSSHWIFAGSDWSTGQNLTLCARLHRQAHCCSTDFIHCF